jgi:hypothetical protein
VTLPGTIATVTASGTTTVVTVIGPNQIVHPGVVTKKRVRTTIRTPRRVVRVGGRIIRLRGKSGVLGTRVVVGDIGSERIKPY